MKLQPDKSNAPTINAYERTWIEVNGIRFDQSLSVTSLSDVPPSIWGTNQFESLNASNFSPWADSGCELIVFGSGQKLRFPKAQWLQSLISQGIGVETMDTPAACRTYNILASEGRKVVALLLIES
jgi:uncharacterized protein